MKAIGKIFHTLLRILRNLLIFLVLMVVLAFLAAFFMVYRGERNYPVHYGDAITAVAEEAGLSPHLILGVVKSESNFDADVVASDGGEGLMQLMPDAVDFMADRLDEDASTWDLKDPETNLRVGSLYLSYLVSRYQSEDLAIVAYNAGMSNVDEWLKDGIIDWDYRSMQNIPYAVPRKYVKRVNEAQEVYETFYPDEIPDDSSEYDRLNLAFHHLLNAVNRYLPVF
ncbi:MAG: lytic transglycosylase domain-containing protein [Peptoniphilaceae bacterium]|nr:lytic transglycosylase domain-containing protein [Peptoniphilaceae bacterium]MDY6085271.1 lytic transglycosylase domain-containing protein [Peptoniphilaceae bacterium]